MKIDYKIETTNKSINTTSVKILVEEKTFDQMRKDADKRLKSSINRFYENFVKNL